MATYTLACCGTVCGGRNVLGTIDLDDAHPAPNQAGWGYLCEVCTAAWRAAIATENTAAAKAGRPALPAAHVAPLGAPRMPAVHVGPPLQGGVSRG